MISPQSSKVFSEKSFILINFLLFFKLEMEQNQADQNQTEKGSTQWRIKQSQIFNITQRFREAMNQYNLESVTHRERCKKSIMRELEISNYSI
jgi:t-SNARE complex subunit (syntaxin)